MSVEAPSATERSVNELLNGFVQRVARRADRSNPLRLERTFVEVDQISAGLRSPDHGVVYGRRGTGKTHAFTHLSRELDQAGDLSILIDLRRIGSNGGLYGDGGEEFAHRASQLLIDVIEEFHSRLLAVAVDHEQFAGLLSFLDALGEAATDVRVEGPVEQLEETEDEKKRACDSKWEVGIKSLRSPTVTMSGGTSQSKTDRAKRSQKRTGTELPRIRFGQLARAIEGLCVSVAPARIWLLLDEWSSLPLDLQPVLADMLKRTFFTTPGLTVKIGAIERRSNFVERKSANNYLGIELGADTGAALNLDEHLVDPDEHEAACQFYGSLIQRHLSVMAEEAGETWPSAVEPLKRLMFERDAFSWLVRAAEGVPRDAINILGLAAGYARKSKIQPSHIQKAARTYYLQDKEKGIKGNLAAERTWEQLQREVVLGKKSRTFLVRRSLEQSPSDVILDLYDARLIHLLKPGLSADSRPGLAYDGYAIDYGSYVHLLRNTEMTAAWESARKPWLHSEGEDFLPDHFDEGIVFPPIRGVTGHQSGRPRGQDRRQKRR